MSGVILSTAYLPPVQYFTKLYQYDEVWIEQCDNYQKQTYRNRCVIAAPNGPLSLTVPVEKYEEIKCPMKDVRISDHGRWRHLHWNALVSAYENSPFFEYYVDDFQPFYENKWTFLCDYNEALMNKICELIDLHPQVYRTTSYLHSLGDDVDDLRETIHPKHDFSADKAFAPQQYYQVFQQKNGFLKNMSIVDLLFNMGPESLVVLKNSLQ